MEFLKPKTSCKTSCFFLNDAMFWRCFWKNIDVDVFDDVLQNAKHRANDASNDVNRPPLPWSPQKWRHLCKMKLHFKIQSRFATFGPGVSSFCAVNLESEELVFLQIKKMLHTKWRTCYPQYDELTTHKIQTYDQRSRPITKHWTTQPSRSKLC